MRNKNIPSSWLWSGFIALDILCIAVAMFAANQIPEMVSGVLRTGRVELHPGFVVVSLLVWTLLFAAKRLYLRSVMLGDSPWQRKVVTASAVACFTLVLISFAEHQDLPARGWLIWTWLFATAAILAARGAVVAGVRYMRRRGFLTSGAIIVGANEQGRSMAAKLLSDKQWGLKAMGFLDEYLPVGTPMGDGPPLLGRPLDFEEHCTALQCKDVIIIPAALSWETQQELLSRIHQAGSRLHALVVTGSNLLVSGEMELLTVAGMKLIDVAPSSGAGVRGILAGLGSRFLGKPPSVTSRKPSREHFETVAVRVSDSEAIKPTVNSPIVYIPPQEHPVRRKAAVFLDRDGVINHNRADHVKSWDEFVFIDGAIPAIRALGAEFYVIVLTNQSVIGSGLTHNISVHYIHSCMISEVRQSGGRIDAVLWCPHTAEADCGCRKPKPGLLERAAAEFGIDLESSYFIGDALSDVEAAIACNVSPILVRTGRGAREEEQLKARHLDHIHVSDTLLTAASFLLSTEVSTREYPAHSGETLVRSVGA